MTRKEHKRRSERIVQFVMSHPAINTAQVCRMAGGADVFNFSNALAGKRLVSRNHLHLFEKVLKEYGFTVEPEDG